MPYKLRSFRYFERYRTGRKTTLSVFEEDKDRFAALAEKHQITRPVLFAKILDDYLINERQRENRAARKSFDK